MRQLRRRGLKAVTAAPVTALTTPARARAALPQAELSADDAELQRQIDQFSMEICRWIRIPATVDGRCTIAVETVQEKLEIHRSLETFYLSRAPVIHTLGVPNITLLMLEDEVLLNTEMEIINAAGLVRFIDEDGKGYPVAGEVIVEYQAGYNVRSMSQAQINPNAIFAPDAFESAIFALLRGSAASARRDPSIRSEASDEVDSFTYFSEGGMNVAWREAEQHLKLYRRMFN